jgi:hypothetical protein
MRRDVQPEGDESSEPGPVESTVDEVLAELETLSPVHDALAALARSLARSLDRRALLLSGQDGLATAALARELRATLELLMKGEGDDVDSAVTRIGALLSSPVLDPKNVPAQPGATGR